MSANFNFIPDKTPASSRGFLRQRGFLVECDTVTGTPTDNCLKVFCV